MGRIGRTRSKQGTKKKKTKTATSPVSESKKASLADSSDEEEFFGKNFLKTSPVVKKTQNCENGFDSLPAKKGRGRKKERTLDCIEEGVSPERKKYRSWGLAPLSDEAREKEISTIFQGLERKQEEKEKQEVMKKLVKRTLQHKKRNALLRRKNGAENTENVSDGLFSNEPYLGQTTPPRAEASQEQRRRLKSVPSASSVASSSSSPSSATFSQPRMSSSSFWTEEQLECLREARQQVPANAPGYWGAVARLVPGQGPRDCLLQTFQLFDINLSSFHPETTCRNLSPQKGKRSAAAAAPSAPAGELCTEPHFAKLVQDIAASSGRETGRRRRQLQELLSLIEQGYEDSVFDPEPDDLAVATGLSRNPPQSHPHPPKNLNPQSPPPPARAAKQSQLSPHTPLPSLTHYSSSSDFSPEPPTSSEFMKSMCCHTPASSVIDSLEFSENPINSAEKFGTLAGLEDGVDRSAERHSYLVRVKKRWREGRMGVGRRLSLHKEEKVKGKKRHRAVGTTGREERRRRYQDMATLDDIPEEYRDLPEYSLDRDGSGEDEMYYWSD